MTPDDIVKLGPQWLIQGDCMDVLPRLPAACADMVFCDPPYGVTACPWDVDASGVPQNAQRADRRTYALSMADLGPQLLRVAKVNAAIIVTAMQPFTTHVVTSLYRHFRYALVWHKVRPGRFLHAKNMPLSAHEDILVFYRKKPPYAPQMIPREKPYRYCAEGKKKYGSVNYSVQNHRPELGVRTYTHRHPTSILTFSRPCRGQHPTQKPVALIEWLIRSYCPEGGLVIDPTCGVGTTSVAAQQTGRRSICIERSAEFHAAAVDRVRAAQAAPIATAPLRPKRAHRAPPAAQRSLWVK